VIECILQQLKVVNRRLLGQLDDHLAGRNTEILQQLQGPARLVGGFEQGFRRHVEEQFAGQLLFVKASASALAASDFQFVQAAGLTGDGEQGDGRVQRAVGRAATEGFKTHNSPFGKRNDGLEQAV
jgi:hypothetical protein